MGDFKLENGQDNSATAQAVGCFTCPPQYSPISDAAPTYNDINQESNPSPVKSNRPGRRGALKCHRCRKMKRGTVVQTNSIQELIQAPCILHPGDPYGACTPCNKAGLSAQCGERTFPGGKTDVRQLAHNCSDAFLLLEEFGHPQNVAIAETFGELREPNHYLQNFSPDLPFPQSSCADHPEFHDRYLKPIQG